MVSLIAQDVQRILAESRIATESQREEIDQLVKKFLLQPITPEATWQFENAVEDRLRELGRSILEVVYNRLEADDTEEMPKQVEFDQQEWTLTEGAGYGALAGLRGAPLPRLADLPRSLPVAAEEPPPDRGETSASKVGTSFGSHHRRRARRRDTIGKRAPSLKRREPRTAR